MEQNPVLRELEPSDLDFSSKSNFVLQCSIDSQVTNAKFEWIDYCPAVFRNLQNFGEIDADDYMDSIRGQETLRFLISHKKNRYLRFQHDDRFMINILSKSEMKVLLEILPKYYRHLQKYRRTLLAKFYGLHVVKPQGRQKVHFVVVGNVLRSDIRIHKQFNLRISSQGRLLSKTEVEEDLNVAFHLPASVRRQLIMQIKQDCNFLEDIGVTHYSLLLGMHVCAAPFEAVVQNRHTCKNKAGSDDSKNITSDGHGAVQYNAAEDMTTDNHSELSYPIEFEGKFGVQMAARAVKREGIVASLRCTGKEPVNNVILYFGIINILQEHKRLKHVFKSLQSDPQTVSRVNPRAYSAGFKECIGRIFPEDDSDPSKT